MTQHAERDLDIILPDITGDIGAILRHWAATTPHREALCAGDRSWSWTQLADRVRRLGAALHAEGVRPGDRVALLAKNDPAHVETALAAAAGGFACAVVNWRLAPDEVHFVLADAGARVLVVGAEFVSTVEQVRGELPDLQTVIVLGGDADEYEPLLAAAPQGGTDGVPQPDDCFLLLYTSGTTGFPKGAMLTHRTMAAHTLNAFGAFGFEHGSVNLVAMPLFHVGGMSWALQSLYTGGRTIVVREVVPAAILAQIEKERVTHAFFVPTVYEYLLAVPEPADHDLSSVRCFGYGGSPMPLPLMRRCLLGLGPNFYQVYGATEASGAFCVLGPADHRDPAHPERLGSVGQPLSGVELRVVDPGTESDVPTGTTGEFWIRTDQTMAGYWNRPDDTASAHCGDWYRTGDIGHADAEGFVFITDRVKDMIVSGGENVYPAEVERVLVDHPGVAEVCLIGVPDPVYGETVKAVVVPQQDATVDAAELIGFCRERMAHYKCPRSVDVTASLPRNSTGKVLRRTLREPYWAGRDRVI